MGKDVLKQLDSDMEKNQSVHGNALEESKIISDFKQPGDLPDLTAAVKKGVLLTVFEQKSHY